MGKQPLHDLLCEKLGSKNCYFEPPANIHMTYPCVVYHHSNDLDNFADNTHYISTKRYTVTVIDEDPDSKIPNRMKEILYCSSDRNFTADGLHHFVHTLFYSGPRLKEEENE